MTSLHLAFQESGTSTTAVERLVRAAQGLQTPVDPEGLWTLLAEKTSPPWAEARRLLDSAAADLSQMQSDEHRPLGSIGRALEGEDLIAAETAHLHALAAFTIADETLRANPALRETHDQAREILCPEAPRRARPAAESGIPPYLSLKQALRRVLKR